MRQPSVPSTAILLFSRSAGAEARAKHFGVEEKAGREVADALISRTEMTIARVGLPILRIDETQQVGDSFGERLATALARAFAGGYRNLLVIGNDAPSLTANHLRRAAASLAIGKNCIVPDRRGGVALLAITRSAFHRPAFTALPWETGELRDALAGFLGQALVLASVADINHLTDLRQDWFYLKALLRGLPALIFNEVRRSISTPFPNSFLGDATALRGPPAVRLAQ